MKEKTITVVASIIGVAVFIAIVAGASFSYYTSSVTTSNEGNNTSSFQTAQIGVNFDGGDEVSIDNMIPGDSFTKTFTLTNSGTATLSYQIIMKDVTNTFTSQSDLVYVLSENGTEIKTGTFPATSSSTETKTAISDTLTIGAGVTKSYTFTVTYTNTTENQIDDMGSSISGEIYIEEVSN